MPAQKLFPCRLPAPLRCRFDPVPREDLCDRATGQFRAPAVPVRASHCPRTSDINLRRQNIRLSGVTIVATSARKVRPPQPLGLGGQPAALIVVQAKSLAAELFPEHSIFFAQRLSCVQPALVQPARQGDEQEAERVQFERLELFRVPVKLRHFDIGSSHYRRRQGSSPAVSDRSSSWALRGTLVPSPPRRRQIRLRLRPPKCCVPANCRGSTSAHRGPFPAALHDLPCESDCRRIPLTCVALCLGGHADFTRRVTYL